MKDRKRSDRTIMVGENLLGEVWLEGPTRTTNPSIHPTTFTEMLYKLFARYCFLNSDRKASKDQSPPCPRLPVEQIGIQKGSIQF